MELETKHGTDYTKVWAALESPVYRVMDEEGDNPGEGRIRHLLGKYWLYVDDVSGYEIFETHFVSTLILSAENCAGVRQSR